MFAATTDIELFYCPAQKLNYYFDQRVIIIVIQKEACQ